MMDLDKLEKAVKLLDELGVGATLVMQYAEAKDLLDEAREESITAQEMFELHENAMMDEASKQMRYHLNTVRQLMNTIDEEV